MWAGRDGLVDVPIPTDLGFSWRPDKPTFPDGRGRADAPEWMQLSSCPMADDISPQTLAGELDLIRAGVASFCWLDQVERDILRARIAKLAVMYEKYFTSWLRQAGIDWVVALNMTLSDAAPVTVALHAAAKRHFAARRFGGILFWDHDLFGSCGIRDLRTGSRIYPEEPNELTLVPQRNGFTHWAVVSEALATEARSYPTNLAPDVVPNVLPVIRKGSVGEPGEAFARQHALEPGRPILLNPVRMFRIKGIDIAVQLQSAMKMAAMSRGIPVPYLLVFGRLDEDPGYADEVLALARALGVQRDVRFLDGVPLVTYCDGNGRWQLDEIDLLRLAAETGGAVVFTPSVANVETVGLGPALAALAGLPCAITDYVVFEQVYGSSFAVTRVGRSPEDLRTAADKLLDALAGVQSGDGTVTSALAANRRMVEARFPNEPWRKFWHKLAVTNSDEARNVR
jgi:hypothetical protein